MTCITEKELQKLNNALEKSCNFCSLPCPFDNCNDCLMSKIKDLLREHLGHDQPKRFHVVVQENSFLVIDIKNDVIRGSCRTYDDAVTFSEELENEKEDD